MGAADVGRAVGAAEGWIRNGNGAPYSIPFVYNANPLNLQKYATGLDRVLTNTGRCKVAWIGPSTMAGLGAGTGVNGYGGMRGKAIPAAVAAMMNNVGLPSHWDNFFGTAAYFPNTNEIDPRLTVGSDVSQAQIAQGSLGGPFFRHAVAATSNVLAFTPTANYNACDIYMAKSPNFATCGIKINGTLVDTVDTNNATTQSYAKFSYTSGNASPLVTPGAYAISLDKGTATTNQLYVGGIDCWNTTAYKVTHANMGWGSSSSVDWANPTFPWGPLTALPIFAPDLSVFMEGVNDWYLGVALATFRANLQAQITAAKQTGDAIVCSFAPDGRTSGSGYAPVATQAEYNAINRDLALANSCPFVDLNAAFVSFANSQALGRYWDLVHNLPIGYSALGRVIAKVLTRSH